MPGPLTRRLPTLWSGLWSVLRSTGRSPDVATPNRRGQPAPPGSLDGMSGWDLIADQTGAECAGRRILHLFGQVLDFDGQGQADVTVEIWQGNAAVTPTDLVDISAGHGAVRTDRFGGYRFRTLLPVAAGTAPPVINARLSPPRGRVLATQLYLLDDPQNARDWHFGSLGPSQRAAVSLDPVAQADGQLEAGFNFVL